MNSILTLNEPEDGNVKMYEFGFDQTNNVRFELPLCARKRLTLKPKKPQRDTAPHGSGSGSA
jgi:hypothetical protein